MEHAGGRGMQHRPPWSMLVGEECSTGHHGACWWERNAAQATMEHAGGRRMQHRPPWSMLVGEECSTGTMEHAGGRRMQHYERKLIMIK